MTLKVSSRNWNERISHIHNFGTKADLQKLQIELLNLRQKIGEFIDRYLDDYDAQMTMYGPGHKTWKLYREKHEDYGKVEQLLRNLEYFMKK